jgi:hypothetical protein
MGQERIDLRLGHVGWMPDVMEEDEPLDPLAIALFGPAAVVAGTQSLAEAIEELGLTAGQRRSRGMNRPGRGGTAGFWRLLPG